MRTASDRGRCTPLTLRLDELRQVSAVFVLPQLCRRALDIGSGEPLIPPGDLLQAGNLVALALFDGFDILRCLQQALERTRIQPSEPSTEQLDRQQAAREIGLIDGRNLELTARGWRDTRSDLNHLRIVEVQPGDRPFALGVCGLLRDGKHPMIAVELYHAKPLGIYHLVREYRRTVRDGCVLLQQCNETLAVEDVVSEHQAHRAVPDELFTDEECLSQPLWSGLHGVAQVDAKLTPVTEHSLKG